MTKVISLLILVLAFVSCDGRNRVYKSNADVLKESGLWDLFSEELVFIPESRTNITTDTILSTGFQIKISYSSTDYGSIKKTVKTKNNTSITYHYKNFKADYTVLKDNTTIKNGKIDNRLFYNYAPPDFWQNAIMQYVWVDYDHDQTNSIKLNTCFVIPQTTTFKDFALIINQYGATQIIEHTPIKTL